MLSCGATVACLIMLVGWYNDTLGREVDIEVNWIISFLSSLLVCYRVALLLWVDSWVSTVVLNKQKYLMSVY